MSYHQIEKLCFGSLDQVSERLDLLLKEGYTKKGQWNLAQICEHLSDWFSYMLEGYPRFRFPMSWIAWSVRVTVGKSMLRKTLKRGQMKRSGATLPETVHEAAGLCDTQSVARLKEKMQQFSRHQDPYCVSPLFGELSAEDGLALQLIHCAHHLSFLIPKSESH